MTYDCIVSYHTNPYTCGVAQFSQALARTLGVGVVSVVEFMTHSDGLPLLSLKLEEIPEDVIQDLLLHLSRLPSEFDLFLHGIQQSELEQKFVSHARNVYVATAEYAYALSPNRPDIVSLFAPGVPVVDDNETFDLTLLTFGMAHKIRAGGYRKLGEILDGDHRSVQLEISTALHEGMSFSEDFFSVNEEISEVFKGSVRFLGFLADSEVSRRLRAADALVAFFPLGVRENNSTVVSAMRHGCAVITNTDPYTPSWMKHGESIFDIDRLTVFPSSDELKNVGRGAMTAAEPYTFARLAELMSKRET